MFRKVLHALIYYFIIKLIINYKVFVAWKSQWCLLWSCAEIYLSMYLRNLWHVLNESGKRYESMDGYLPCFHPVNWREIQDGERENKMGGEEKVQAKKKRKVEKWVKRKKRKECRGADVFQSSPTFLSMNEQQSLCWGYRRDERPLSLSLFLSVLPHPSSRFFSSLLLCPYIMSDT